MAKAYYSTVFEQPAGDVWKIIRDFNNYPVWVRGEGVSEIEQGKSGASRPTNLPVSRPSATLRVTPVVGGDRAFGRRCSIATPTAAPSWPGRWPAGSRPGSNRSGTRWL
ncbi:hypothetical protein [Bradyrhizobium septentrionale]|uniref:Polyketide cyclase / dehydrase and lipid transport n=1 Tax=Bradyrhizobium septentrionale TaxID=1404411 RepID=A0ABZ2P1L8_9BRAD|nr:hypothetical protein [Bradyrhizobium septentrionale]UGY18645.1 hypothetical protein HAP48_0015050 [Bradyrhizobium septentrionale]UGY27359.1 hypothetical protein HU675_0011690 [Bradyrhizobium septentrionale]